MKRASRAAPEIPGLELVRLLGTGGFSDVFLYEQHLPRRRVAVKVLIADGLNTAAQEAFVGEANQMAQLSAHPYIVTIFHADVTQDDRPYFVMEYCSGPSLSELYKQKAFDTADALRTGVRLSSAVATAHGAGILHRDIKPANVLTNDFGWPALTDFGISSAIEDELPTFTTGVRGLLDPAGTGVGTRGGAGSANDQNGSGSATSTSAIAGGTAAPTEGQSVGMSVPWSPPEMFGDDPHPDVRSDVFSLAATIHTLLAGRTPFEIPGRSNGALNLIGRIERGAITPIGRDDVPASLVAVLAKGMATRPEDRYASAVEFARALQRIELELGYAPTPIEVPTALLAASGGGAGNSLIETVDPSDAPTSLRSVLGTADTSLRGHSDDDTQVRSFAPRPGAVPLAGSVPLASSGAVPAFTLPVVAPAWPPMAAINGQGDVSNEPHAHNVDDGNNDDDDDEDEIVLSDAARANLAATQVEDGDVTLGARVWSILVVVLIVVVLVGAGIALYIGINGAGSVPFLLGETASTTESASTAETASTTESASTAGAADTASATANTASATSTTAAAKGIGA